MIAFSMKTVDLVYIENIEIDLQKTTLIFCVQKDG